MGGISKQDELPTVPKELDVLVRKGSKGEAVSQIQFDLNRFGYGLKVDGDFGPLTEAAVKDFQKKNGLVVDGIVGPLTMAKLSQPAPEPVPVPTPVPPPAPAPAPGPSPAKGVAPWLDEAKKHEGKKESDSTFNKYLSGFWGLVGLPNYKTIIGTSFAWCGLFVAAMLYEVDLPFQKNGAAARNWAKYGQHIDWKKDGVPRGAILHINHKGDCSSGSSNHVGFANGDCSAEDLNKKGAYIDIYGGNQSNTAKVSTFGVFELCEARWPVGVPLPGKVTQSKDCASKSASGESTR